MDNPMLWVGYPRSWTAGRIRRPQYVTLHYTAGSEGPSSAEGGANYDKNRTDGTSCHAFFDSQGPGLQEVPFGDRSHSALYHGNEIGIHFEICGTRQTREQWMDGTSMATLKTCALAVRYACLANSFDMRRLSVDEVRAAYYAKGTKPTGICDHYDVTRAYPEDGGDHSDVGPEFPWDIFMPMVIGGTSSVQEDDMFMLRQKDTGYVVMVTGEVDPASHKVRAYNLPAPANGAFEDYKAAGIRLAEVNYINPDYYIIDQVPPSGGGGSTGLTYEQTVQAAQEGAERAEDS